MHQYNDDNATPQLRPNFIRYVTDSEYFRACGCSIRVGNNPTRTKLVELADELLEQLRLAPADAALKTQYEDMLACLDAIEGDTDGYTLKKWYVEEHLVGTDRPSECEVLDRYRDVREGRYHYRMAIPEEQPAVAA